MQEYIFSIFVYYFFINHISEFILGICLFYIFEKRLFNYDKKFKVLYYLFFLFALYFSGQTNGRFPVNVSNALISILLFLAVSRSPNMVSVNSLLSYFGVRSLSIFLSHLLVIEYTSIYINRLIEHEVLNFLCIGGFSLLITMIISEFTYQLIDKRFSRYLNNKFIGNQIPTSI